jgi:vacuolar protein sorting-associated protein 72
LTNKRAKFCCNYLERKSTRKSTAAKSAELRKRVKQRDEEYQRRKKKMKLKVKKNIPMTQEELLEEAKITEQENMDSLGQLFWQANYDGRFLKFHDFAEKFQQLELEKKRMRPIKKDFKGPMIRYHSYSAPLIEEISSCENQTVDVDDTMMSTGKFLVAKCCKGFNILVTLFFR